MILILNPSSRLRYYLCFKEYILFRIYKDSPLTFRSISSECCSIFKVQASLPPLGDSFVIIPFSVRKVNSFFAFFSEKSAKILRSSDWRNANYKLLL